MNSKTAIVVVTDLVGSTKLRVELGDAPAEELRRAHDEALKNAIETHGGHVVKGLGDGVLAVHEAAGPAVRGAIAAQQRIHRLSRREELSLHIRVGISAGDVTFDDGDVFGTAVIEASRLCDSAAGDQILCAEAVRYLARGRHDLAFSESGDYTLKGLPGAVPVVEAHWSPDEESESEIRLPIPKPLAAGDTPFTGRTTPLDHLEREWTVAGSKGVRAVLIAGEAGIGKTRLAAEFAGRAYDTGATILYGSCSEDSNFAYEPFAGALSYFVNHMPAEAVGAGAEGPVQMSAGAEGSVHGNAGAGGSAQVSSGAEGSVQGNAGAEVPAIFGRYPEELVRLAPDLSVAIPGLADPIRSDPETQRHRLFTAVGSWLQSCTGTDGAIVVLDDLHWADAATISLVGHLIRNPGDGRLLLMGTYRDSDLDRGRPFAEAIGELLRLENVSRIDLSGLEVDSVRTLVASVVGGEEDDRSADLAQTIRRETDGNPFFVMEVLSHLAETGAIARDESGQWTATTGAFVRLPIPHGAREVIGRRLSRLSETTNDVLTTAAVVGQEFAVDTVAGVLGVAEDRVLEACEEAVAANVLREQEVGRFAFTHALVRSALYGGLSATRAAQLHFTVGETVEALGGPAADLADHYARVPGNPTAINKAVDYLIAAGEEASGALAPEQAVRRYREAVERLDALGERDTGRRAKAMVGLGIAQRNSGDSNYRRTLLDAADTAERLRDGYLLAEAALANFRGIWSSVFEIDSERVNVLRAALQLLPDDRPAVRARVLATLAVELYFTDEHDEIEELTDEAETIARRLGEPEVLHDVLRINTQATLNPGTFRDMHAREGEAVELAEELGDPVRLVQACCGRSLGLWAIGDGERARGVLERAVNMSVEFVHEPSSFWIATLRTAGAVADGDPDVAEKHAKEMYARGRRLGFRDVREWFANALFATRLLAGRLGEFEAHAQARLGEVKLPAVSRANNALILAHAGKLEEAAVILDRMVERIDDLPYDLTWQWIIYLLSWAARSVSYGERSLGLYERLLPHAGMAVVTAPAVYGTTDFALGLTAAESGLLDSACEHFSDAASFEMRAGMNGWLTFTRLEWACALLARDRSGDREKAVELLDLARESAERIGNRRVLARIREVRGRAQRS